MLRWTLTTELLWTSRPSVWITPVENQGYQWRTGYIFLLYREADDVKWPVSTNIQITTTWIFIQDEAVIINYSTQKAILMVNDHSPLHHHPPFAQTPPTSAFQTLARGEANSVESGGRRFQSRMTRDHSLNARISHSDSEMPRDSSEYHCLPRPLADGRTLLFWSCQRGNVGRVSHGPVHS